MDSNLDAITEYLYDLEHVSESVWVSFSPHWAIGMILLSRCINSDVQEIHICLSLTEINFYYEHSIQSGQGSLPPCTQVFPFTWLVLIRGGKNMWSWLSSSIPAGLGGDILFPVWGAVIKSALSSSSPLPGLSRCPRSLFYVRTTLQFMVIQLQKLPHRCIKRNEYGDPCKVLSKCLIQLK